MSPHVVQLVGFLVWFGAELWGVFTRKKNDTTSEWVWAQELKWPILRPILGVFLVSLLGHILLHWPLLP